VATLTTNQRRATALASTRVRPPDQNHFLSIFCRAPPPNPSADRRKKKVRKWFCRSGSLQSLQNGSLKKFIAYAVPLRRFSVPSRTWHYLLNARDKSKIRSPARNTSHWPLTSFVLPARCSLGSLINFD